MAADYDRFRATADNMITKYGMAAKLRRGDVDRDCTVVITNYSPMERAGQLINLTDRKVLMSAIGLTVPPSEEDDVLVTFVQPAGTVEDEILTIAAPPGRIEMNGTVVMWRLQVRR